MELSAVLSPKEPAHHNSPIGAKQEECQTSDSSFSKDNLFFDFNQTCHSQTFALHRQILVLHTRFPSPHTTAMTIPIIFEASVMQWVCHSSQRLIVCHTLGVRGFIDSPTLRTQYTDDFLLLWSFADPSLNSRYFHYFFRGGGAPPAVAVAIPQQNIIAFLWSLLQLLYHIRGQPGAGIEDSHTRNIEEYYERRGRKLV
jgi:hypothetical protein